MNKQTVAIISLGVLSIVLLIGLFMYSSKIIKLEEEKKSCILNDMTAAYKAGREEGQANVLVASIAVLKSDAEKCVPTKITDNNNQSFYVIGVNCK